MTKYNTGLINNMMNFTSISNESLSPAYDYLYDNIENNNNTSYSNGDSGSHHLAMILQQLFSKMFDNKTSLKLQTNSLLSDSSLFPYETFLPSSIGNKNSYYLFTTISLWFILIINPIVVKQNKRNLFQIFFFHFCFKDSIRCYRKSSCYIYINTL